MPFEAESRARPDENTRLLPPHPRATTQPDGEGNTEDDRQGPRESMSSATFWRIGAISGAAAVGLGAFGVHGLKKRISDPQKLASWSTAAQYQLIHSLALLVARSNSFASTLFTSGMVMFSGSIYALILDPDTYKPLGPVTPLGGMCLIAGWIALALVPPTRTRWPRF